MRKNTIVTISRQYGSGGREIAEILAKKMGVRCYDRQIVYLAAEKIGNADMDVDSILEEAYNVPGGMGIFSGLSFGSDIVPDYNKMYKEQAALIKKLANISGGVFLGRCADAILADTKDCYHIFIYASDEFRKRRSHDFYGDMTLKEMEREDKTRQRYYNYYTDRIWGNPQNYDLMINTTEIPLLDAAELIIEYIERVQKAADYMPPGM